MVPLSSTPDRRRNSMGDVISHLKGFQCDAQSKEIARCSQLDIVIKSIKEILVFSHGKPCSEVFTPLSDMYYRCSLNLYQVLQYMRISQCYQEEVVAVVLEDVASALTTLCDVLRKCIRAEEVGWTVNISRDFLRSNSSSLKISRATGRKRKCCTIMLKSLPSQIRDDIRSSKLSM